MATIGNERKRWFKSDLPREYDEHFGTENKLEYM